MGENVERISFEGSQGDMLAARLHRPPGPARAYALFAHCFTCGKDLSAAVRISEALAVHGFATLRFDFTGLGESEGDFADTHFSSNVEDLVRAGDFLAQHHAPPVLLIGHSLGGTAVLAAARRLTEVRAVATLGAPFAPSHVKHLLKSAEEAPGPEDEAEVRIADRPFRVKRAMLEDLDRHTPAETLRKLGAALLIMHSPQDEVVDIDNARRIYEAARHPKSFVTLDGAQHLLPRRRNAQYAAQMLATWAGRYVPESEEPELEKGEVEVHARQSFLQQIRTNRHDWLADEPRSLGGEDQGPTPYELLLAALGTCTSMTLQMYARRKGLALKAVRVRLRHDRIHARDCEECEKAEGQIDRIERELVLEGDLDATHRQRLLEIADRCPVHRTLENEIRIRTKLDE